MLLINIAELTFKFEGPFLSLLSRDYGSPLRTVDFQGHPAAAAARIDQWASHETRGRITGIISPADLSAMTRLIFTNAVYFKGFWDAQFGKKDTRDADFTLGDGSKTRVKMMHQFGDVFYTENDDFQVLELLYKGHALSMVVFLQRRHDSLNGFEAGLTLDKLRRALEAMGPKKVNVYLPRLKLTGMYALNDTLTSLGMRDACSKEKADFTGISEERPFFIYRVVQKTFAEVNEQGTEAAATTIVQFRDAAAHDPEPRLQFRADRPFMFLIRHRPSNCILFMGRVTNPPAAGNN